MKKLLTLSLGAFATAALQIFPASAQSPAASQIATGRTALANQTPAGIAEAVTAFKAAAAAEPANAEANFFNGAAIIYQELSSSELQTQLKNFGLQIPNANPYELEISYTLDPQGYFLPTAAVTTDSHLAYLNSKSSVIDAALTSLDKITDENFVIMLSADETSLLDTKVDYADVCLLRAGLRLAKAALHLANSYNVSGEYRVFANLYAAGNLTPQAVLSTFPQLFNLSATPAQRSDARTQIQLAHAEWNKALAAIKTKRPNSEGSVLGPIGYSEDTPFLFAFESIAAAEEVDAQFDALVTSLSSQVTFPVIANEDFALEGYTLNLSGLVTSPSGPRALAPTRFDRGFFRPSSWPDVTLGGIFPGATQDDMNDAGNFLFVLQPTVYEPYQFWLLAGTPDEPGYFEDGQVLFNKINGIAVDANGNIYVADKGNNIIRRISIDNKVTTIAGQKWSNWNERQALEKNHIGTSYNPGILSEIDSIAVDQAGNSYFAVHAWPSGLVYKISENGTLSKIAGKLISTVYGRVDSEPKDGYGGSAIFGAVSALAVDKNANIYLCDYNAIRKIAPSGQVTTIAGKLGEEDSEGYVDGAGSVARFNNPTGIAVDNSGVIYVTDSDNFVIRKIQPDGTTSTFVGDAKISNHFDGKGVKARLSGPNHLAIDSIGNLYFSDSGTIRKVKPDGAVTTLAGKINPVHRALRIADQMGIQEAAGEAAIFGDDSITGLAVDRRGTLYASFQNSIYEAESIAAPPTATPFPGPNPLPTPLAKNPDSTPVSTPNLLSLSLSTTTVDLSLGSSKVSFTASVSGDISSVNLGFNSFSGNAWSWPSSDKLMGAIDIPSYTKAGVYKLNSLSYYWGFYPNNQNANFYGDTVPSAFKDISITIINPFSDLTPPIVHSLKFLESEVNTSNSSAKVRYRVQISDDLSGFSWLNLSFRNSNSNQFLYPDGLGAWNSLVAIDGDLKTYEGLIEVPQGTAEGEWVLQSIWVSDQAGNGNSVTLNNEMQDIKINVSDAATNPIEVEDQFTPWPLALSLEKNNVDVTEENQKVKVYLEINNDDMPVVYYVSVGFRDEDDVEKFYAKDFKLVSGTAGNGVYEGELLIPRYTKNGTYTAGSIWIGDSKTANSKSINLNPNFFPVALRKTITVTGTHDNTPPVLQGLTIEPSNVDTRNGAAVVLANLTISDDLSGLDLGMLGCEMVLISPSGKEFLWRKIRAQDLISSNGTNGTYQVKFELPKNSEEGVWTIDYIELFDNQHNTRFLIPSNLTAQQLASSTIQVQGWPRGWETVSTSQQTTNQPKAVFTKDSAKFWFPIENMDANWSWGDGDDNDLEYEWSVESTANAENSFSFSHYKAPDEVAQNGNFTAFLNAGQVNVWDKTGDDGTTVEGAQITASRDGQSLLIELKDPVYLAKLQKEMPSYLSFWSYGTEQDFWQNVKVEYVKEDVQLSLGNLTHIVDGADKIPSVNTTPGNHTQDVTITYNGTTSPPNEVGTYTVVAFLNTANYKGRQVATMTISKQLQTIAAFSTISDKVFGAAPFVVTAPTSSSGLPVTLSVKSGPATISANNTVTLTGAGTVVLAANQAGNENYSAASEATTQFNVSNPPPPPAAPSGGGGGGGGGGAPSGGGGGGEPDKSKKDKKGSDKKDKDNDKKDNNKKDNDKRDKSEKKSDGKKSDKKTSKGGDSNKSDGKKSSGKKGKK